VSRATVLSAIVLALGAGAAEARAEEPQDRLQSAISGQYHEAEEALVEAVPATPAEQYQAPAEQYHSESPVDVNVTQTQPSNVNVSVRIFSPGDDGPVTQINQAAAVVEQETVVQTAQPAPAAHAAPEAAELVQTARPQRPAAPEAPEMPEMPDVSMPEMPDVSMPEMPDVSMPDEPPADDQDEPAGDSDESPSVGIPDDWVWEWTSACFGGGPSAAPSPPITGGSGWQWKWSCEEAEDDAAAPAPTAQRPPAAAPIAPQPTVADHAAPQAAAPIAPPMADRPRTHGQRLPARTLFDRFAGAPQSPPLLLLAGAPAQAAVAQTFAPAAERSARPVARARAGVGRGNPSSPTPLGVGGLAAGAAGALSTATSLMLGLWLALLSGALVIVVPRLRRRRWSGPIRRAPKPQSSRLERPG
jgi:hypothetical protein